MHRLQVLRPPLLWLVLLCEAHGDTTLSLSRNPDVVSDSVPNFDQATAEASDHRHSLRRELHQKEEGPSSQAGEEQRNLGWFGFGESKDSTKKDTTALIEAVPCSDHSQAVLFITAFGNIHAGNEACAAEPDPDTCGDGCCRYGELFLCDTSNLFPDLPCVCNRNTRANHPHQGHDHTMDASPAPILLTNNSDSAAKNKGSSDNADVKGETARDGESTNQISQNENVASFLSPKDTFGRSSNESYADEEPNNEKETEANARKPSKDDSGGLFLAIQNFFDSSNRDYDKSVEDKDASGDTAPGQSSISTNHANNGSEKGDTRAPGNWQSELTNEATFLTGWGGHSHGNTKQVSYKDVAKEKDGILQDMLGFGSNKESLSAKSVKLDLDETVNEATFLTPRLGPG